MSQTITLYVDGACRGNPGLGGWGAYILIDDIQHELCGGEAETTNNRMELTAAIEGIKFCAADAKLIIWTDSKYVKQGITEWIHGWKKRTGRTLKTSTYGNSSMQFVRGVTLNGTGLKVTQVTQAMKKPISLPTSELTRP
jgi:ribonuclease HI